MIRSPNDGGGVYSNHTYVFSDSMSLSQSFRVRAAIYPLGMISLSIYLDLIIWLYDRNDIQCFWVDHILSI